MRQARKAWQVAEGHHYHGLRTHFAALASVVFSALKTENRSDNRYTEVVSDPDTLEIAHEVDDRRAPRLLSPRLPSSRQTEEKRTVPDVFFAGYWGITSV